MYEEQAQRLAHALGSLLVKPIEHIGSTAVQGLVAKPIIDMLAVVADVGVAETITERVESTGWVAAPEATDATARKLSYCTPSIARRTHHLHVVERSSSDWLGWLAFRDHLRADPRAAAEYGALKTRLAELHGADPNQRDAYRSGKAAWIAATTAAALRTSTDGWR